MQGLHKLFKDSLGSISPGLCVYHSWVPTRLLSRAAASVGESGISVGALSTVLSEKRSVVSTVAAF